MSNILTNNINPRSGNLITIGGTQDRVSIAGTLSYEDVTNVNAIGIITAQSGIVITATNSNTPKINFPSTVNNIDAAVSTYSDSNGIYAAFGANYAYDSAGNGTPSDASAKSAFVQVDGRYHGAVMVGTGTSGVALERVRIDNSGRLLVGETSSSGSENINCSGISTGATGLFIHNQNGATNSSANLWFGNWSGSTTAVPQARIQAINKNVNTAETDLAFSLYNGTTTVERMLIDSAGRVTIYNGGSNQASEFQSAANQFLITNNGACGLTIDATSTTNCSIHFADGATGDESYRGFFVYNNSDDSLRVGTAGDEQMRIDGAGRLLVGTTSNSVNSTIVAEGNTGNSTGSAELYLQRGIATPPDATSLGSILFADNTSGIGANITAIRDGGTWSSTSKPAYVSIQTTSNGASAPTERARFTSVGFSKFTNTGGYYSVTSPYHEVYSAGSTSNNNQALQIYHAGANGTQYGLVIRTANDQNDSSRYFLNCIGQSTNRAVILSNGGLSNYQANDSNLCDEREKKNIVSLDSKWDKVKSWELKKFHYNEDADTDDLKYGVIAQQVETLCPEVISDWKKSEGVTRKGVKEQQMMWMAIKALQEAMAKIETLETEVQALKGS